MYVIAMVLVGFVAGLMTMAIISLYKWVVKNYKEYFFN